MFEKLTLLQLRALAREHVAHFTAMRDRAPRDPSVNASETALYLALWEDAHAKVMLADGVKAARAALTAQQRFEYEDAIESGSYDHLLAVGA